MMPMMSWLSGIAWLMLTLLLVVVSVVTVAVVVNRRDAGPTTGPDARPGPDEELLRRRYAAGEIDTEEYRTRLATLHSPRRGQ